MKKLLSFIICFWMISSSSAIAQQMDELWRNDYENLGDESSKTKGELFREGNYAMFIHWGLYSKLANKWNDKTYYGIGEWMMHEGMASMPAEDYIAIANDFNPVNFDAKEIVYLAKEAGMKYIIITSKHHDGFAMYDSKVNDFNIVKATPYKKDPMKELAQACKEAGLGFGFYYSHNQDWTTPYGIKGKSLKKVDLTTFDNYVKYKCIPQVEEITKNYGPIELVWFDTPGDMSLEHTRQLVEVVRKNQPNAYVSGRIGHGLGDYNTLGDMEIPVQNVEGIWESVDVTNDAWGYAWYDENWKTPKEILTRLIGTIARGGTYMLNVGPMDDGSLPTPAVKSLKSSGAWIKKYPEVIYGSDPSPWKHALPWGDAVVKGNKIYLCVYDWPSTGKLFLPGLDTPIRSARLLGEQPTALSFKKDDSLVVFDLPCANPDKFIAVIELSLDEAPKVDTTPSLDPQITTTLPVNFAKTMGAKRYQKDWMEKFGEWKHKAQIDNWTVDSEAIWEVDVPQTGYYQVELEYTGEGRIVWQVIGSDGVIVQNQQNSSHLYDFYPMGWISFTQAGKQNIKVKLVEGDFTKASLSGIRFTPIKL